MASIEEDFENTSYPFGGVGANPVVPVGDACTKISEFLNFDDDFKAVDLTSKASFGGVATSLPAAPGIHVDGVGDVSLPLIPEQAKQLIEKCESSSSGLDDTWFKTWQLAPNQVHINNSMWNSGMDELVTSVGENLGYEDISLECVLDKIIVCGDGSYIVKHQDPDIARVIATLVVQPPSAHDGGDLVVYRDRKPRYRHDFGKANGTAPYFTQYAVYYADAEYELENVTKGTCLALVYSISLPFKVHHLQRDSCMPTIDDLGFAMSEMELHSESFALLLDHYYTNADIVKLGADALEKIDYERFRALGKANSALPVDKKLQIFIAKLSHKIVLHPSSVDSDGQDDEHTQKIHWYTTNGEDLGCSMDKSLAIKLNFLNPGNETYIQLWEPYGSSDLEETEEVPAEKDAAESSTKKEGQPEVKTTKYSRYAIMAWPASQHVENSLKFMTVELAVEALLDKKPVSADMLRKFLVEAQTRLGSGKPYWGRDDIASVRFCRSFCELLAQSGDLALTKEFFTVCPHLGMLHENTTLIPILVKILDTFDWGTIGEAVLDVLGHETEELHEENLLHEENPGASHLEMTLLVLDGLTDGPAQKALLKMAVDLFINADPQLMVSTKAGGILSKHIVKPGEKENFDNIIRYLEDADPSALGEVIAAFSHHVDDFKDTIETFSAVADIAAKRIEWLHEEIDALDKPFSYAMPEAKFPIKVIEKFLHGSKTSIRVERLPGVNSLPEARKLATQYVSENQDGASFMMKPGGKGKNAFIRITKTRKLFENRQREVIKYRDELGGLQVLYDGTGAGVVTKKRRLE
ncbi:hypothetical protein PHMEG_00016698 [Phytophthora megakarya]|uniref:Uncharacterized protein n=1 Tax=Phytophthora megakarya TaxID=4795 RepID=A0A225VZ95_9STRA|nr:hypothetical protein PHMEG_00016698 [Phytophthora megakarya]